MAQDVLKAFLSMPYGRTPESRVYWESFESGIREVARLFTNPLLEIQSARDQVNDLVLKENVKNLIDACDFTIAVITSPNPNIFWEVGYTEAQRKPVVYLLDEEASDLVKSPVLVIEALKCAYRSSTLTALARERKLPEDFIRRLTPFLAQAIKSVKARQMEPIIRVFSNREACHLPNFVATASIRINLITTNLSYFADFDRFVVQEKNGVFAFNPPIQKGVNVKILTLDPDSPIIKYRAEELGFEGNFRSYREELRTSSRKFYQRYRHKTNVSIKLYDDLPLQTALMIDDKVITSVMSRDRRSRANLHFLLSMEIPGTRESFETHFSQVDANASRDISKFGWAAESGSGEC